MTLQRKTPMKRDGEGAKRFASQRSSLSSKSELRRSESVRSTKPADQPKRKALAPRSEKRQKQMTGDRIPLIKALIEAGFGCEIGPVLAEAGIVNPDCRGRIEGMHERRKSGQGGSRLNRDNLVPACNSCNGFLEDFAGVVRSTTGDTLVVVEGDPEWERLGSRSDRTSTELPEIRVVGTE